MITLRRAAERHHERRRKQEAWFTFPLADPDPSNHGFGSLNILREGRLAPRAGSRQPQRDAEMITYVREGTLAYQDTTGMSGVIRAGEFQRMTTGQGTRYSETNASPTDWAHVFQIWLRPSIPGLEPGHEQKRFSNAERRGVLCVVASPDARQGSLRIHQDALLYSGVLARGQHIIHELSPGRSAWLHIVEGAATHGEVALRTGDGVGIADERSISLTVNEDTELLLLELGEAHSDSEGQMAGADVAVKVA